MKKISFLLCSLLIGGMLHAQTTATVAPQAPVGDITKVLEIKETNHDFGKIPYGKPAEYDVLIKNISSDSIKIENECRILVSSLP